MEVLGVVKTLSLESKASTWANLLSNLSFKSDQSSLDDTKSSSTDEVASGACTERCAVKSNLTSC